MSALNEEHLVLSVPLGGTEAAEKAHELSTASFFFFFSVRSPTANSFAGDL